MTDARTHARTHARKSDDAPRNELRVRASVRLCVCALLLASCRGREPAPAATSTENDVPVAINSGSPFQYPADLYDQGVQGEVRLRLFVDSAGRVQPESTRVVSGSGAAGLDSAAVRGAALLQFAPAHRNGHAVGMAFYQPVIFHRGGEPAGAPTP